MLEARGFKPQFSDKESVLLLEEGLYEEQIFTGNQTIVSRTFPPLSLTVEQVSTAGNLD